MLEVREFVAGDDNALVEFNNYLSQGKGKLSSVGTTLPLGENTVIAEGGYMAIPFGEPDNDGLTSVMIIVKAKGADGSNSGFPVSTPLQASTYTKGMDVLVNVVLDKKDPSIKRVKLVKGKTAGNVVASGETAKPETARQKAAREKKEREAAATK